MIYIIIGSFFLINLFVGVIFLHFNEAHKNETKGSHGLFLSHEQQNWIEY